MSDRRPISWDDFDNHPRRASAVEPASDETAEAIAGALTSGGGQVLLKWLRANTIEKRAMPGAADAVLRELEAQRWLVMRMEQERDRGLELMRARQKK